MQVQVFPSKDEMGRVAAGLVSRSIHEALRARGEAYVILATGASQFEMLSHLVTEAVDWSKVTCFHLDEYVGMGVTHPASFRKYLKERFVEKVRDLRAFHYVQGDAADPVAECHRLGELIRQHPIDVACIGIGENGHIAFNDPPADFTTEESYLVVDLDEACRRQQFGEGWFPTMNDVPRQAISMSVRQMLRSRRIVCTVPDQRKAEAVRNTLAGEVTPQVPGSILTTHGDCHLFLDEPAASLLPNKEALQ